MVRGGDCRKSVNVCLVHKVNDNRDIPIRRAGLQYRLKVLAYDGGITKRAGKRRENEKQEIKR
jgi:hypothetical protein